MVVGHPRKELAVLVPLVVLAIASQPERHLAQEHDVRVKRTSVWYLVLGRIRSAGWPEPPESTTRPVEPMSQALESGDVRLAREVASWRSRRLGSATSSASIRAILDAGRLHAGVQPHGEPAR